jgi:hypothetical protein
MDKNNYAEDLREIKNIMSRTTKFISLSGLSGVSTGLIALLGLSVAYQLVFKDQKYLVHHPIELTYDSIVRLLMIASGTIMLSVFSAVFFTSQKTKAQNETVLDMNTKRLLINLLIPLVSGGLLCVLLLLKGFVGMLPSITLIFYGLALVNGSKYTLPEIRTLGIIQVIIGLLAFQFINYGLLFWALGFGVVQIVYGLIIQRKY